MNDISKQICPNCAAQLPPQASFCPHCAQSLIPVKTIRSPSLLWKKLLYLGGAAAALALLLLGIASYLLPQTYDGLGQVIYTDADGTYQLLLACSNNRFAPEAEITQEAEVNGEYRMPSRLFINHVDTGANAGQIFLQKVDSVSAQFLTL